MRLAPLVAACVLTGLATGQVCTRPEPPPGGMPTQIDLFVPVTYSDGYQTYGSLIRPLAPPPACGWPVVVFVHPLGQSRGFDLPQQLLIASQGYAVWSYDVRGQGQAQALNTTHPGAGTTLWGAVERLDLAEQITFVANEPGWLGQLDGTRVAVMGSSQGGGHAWNAAAHSGQPVGAPGRPTLTFPPIACAIATELVADPVDDWLRGGAMFSSWFLEAISGSYTGVPFDAGFVQTCRSAFLAQDPAGLAATFVAEGRRCGPLLANSTVPMLYGHAFYDAVDGPLAGLMRMEAMTAPHRALLGTVGHGVVDNVGERALRESLTLRWLHRFLWGVPNEVDLEQPYVLAEVPLRDADRDDPNWRWSHAHVASTLTPASSARWFLHDDFVLRDSAPGAPQANAVVQQTIDPLATTFTPNDYLTQPGVRDLTNVLAVCPLQELVYAFATTAETQIEASPTLHLQVVPDQPSWMLAALLTVQSSEPGAVEALLASGAIASRTSTQGLPEAFDLRLAPVAMRIPAGATLRLRLRNLWLREAPMVRALDAAPIFGDFRVDVVHGAAPFGSWLDLPLKPVQPRLVTDRTWLDLATPQPILGTLRGGSARAGFPYFAAMGLSGHQPSIPFLNDIVPIDGDWLVVLSAASSQAPFFSGLLGFLDAQGEATLSFDFSTAAPLPQILNGLQFTFAAFVWDGPWAPTGAAANPCDVMLR